MQANELKARIAAGALDAYAHLYTDLAAQTKRYIAAIDAFCALYGNDRDIRLFSVPGRSEISGNHTDHNHGEVLAGAHALDADGMLVDGPVARVPGGVGLGHGLAQRAVAVDEVVGAGPCAVAREVQEVVVGARVGPRVVDDDRVHGVAPAAARVVARVALDEL